MSLKVLNSIFHRKQTTFMRSDSAAALTSNPVSTSIQNLSSNLAFQQFSSVSSPSSSISFWNALSMFTNIAGVALMGLMTWNMFKGGPREPSLGDRSSTVDHTITLKADPIEVRAKGGSNNDASSFKKSRKGASVSGEWDQDLTQTHNPLNEYVDKLIDTLFHNLEINEREKVLQTLQAHAAEPYSERTTTAMDDLVFSNQLRSFHNEQEIITLEHNDQIITCHPFHARGALLHMLLGILHQNYLFKYPDALYGRHFILDKLLPALENRVAAMEIQAKRAQPSLQESEIISSSTFSDLQNSNVESEEISFFKDLYKRQFLLSVDPNKAFKDICSKIEELGLDVSEFEVAHPTIQDNKIQIGGIREYLSIGDHEFFVRSGYRFRRIEDFHLSQGELVWALKEAVDAKIAKKL